jgi:S1-C subfamily serine protease
MNWFIDLPLLLLLLGYTINGLRKGFARSIGAIIGVVAGGVAALFVVPLVGGWVPDAAWRLVASIAAAIGLLFLGHALGSSVGKAISGLFSRGPLGFLDRIAGGAANFVLVALVISLLAGSVAPLGIPIISQAIARSAVVGTIDDVTPEPVKAFLARTRSLVVTDTIPTIVNAFGGETGTANAPAADTQTDALRAAAASVVRITGNAFACGQNQAGTGFVIAPDRIVTNAHVLAGVREPVIELQSGDVVAGRVVYFDPIDDLAVIAADGVDASPLALSAKLTTGDVAVVDGYPFGGPFSTGSAEVLDVSMQPVQDIYGSSTNSREIYTLEANVQPGNSGGPLLATDGTVAGVVFAKSAGTDSIGFAMTVDELAPVVDQASGLSESVDSGDCVG